MEGKMAPAFFERLTSPIRGLHEAAYVLALLTFASQLLALLRDRVFAHTLGAGETLDLYYAAFRIPDLVFVFIASLVSAYVLIPRIATSNKEETKKLLSESASFLAIFGGAISVVLLVFMPQILSLLYPSFTGVSGYESFILLARLLLLQPILLGFSGILTSVTQVERKFALFALSPVLYNAGIIAGTIFLYPTLGLLGIGIGVLLGALMHLCIHIPALARASLLPRLTLPSREVAGSVARDSLPRSLALGMSALTALLLTVLAAKVGTGSISVFTLALNLEAVPLALIGASYAVAAFPALSAASNGSDRAEFTRILSASARHLLVWSLVSFGLILVLRAHLVRAILGTGAFDWDATRLTAAMLAIFAAGLAAQGLVLLFSRALYAARQSWRPFFYQLSGGVVTVLTALFLLSLPYEGFPAAFAEFLRVGDVPGAAILLVALSATLGQVFLALLSLVAVRSAAPGLLKELLRPFCEGVLAAALGGAAAYGMLALVGEIAPLTTLAAVFTEGLLAGIVGLFVAGTTLRALKSEEFNDLTRAITRLPGIRGILPPSAEEPPQ